MRGPGYHAVRILHNYTLSKKQEIGLCGDHLNTFYQKVLH